MLGLGPNQDCHVEATASASIAASDRHWNKAGGSEVLGLQGPRRACRGLRTLSRSSPRRFAKFRHLHSTWR